MDMDFGKLTVTTAGLLVGADGARFSQAFEHGHRHAPRRFGEDALGLGEQADALDHLALGARVDRAARGGDVTELVRSLKAATRNDSLPQ